MESTLHIGEIVNFAMKRGATSLSYYTRCAASFAETVTAGLFKDLCSHERTQRLRLREAQTIIRLRSSAMEIGMRSIREYLVDAKPAHKVTMLQSLFWASVRAETSKRLYDKMVQHVNEPRLRTLFQSMAQQEEKKKRQIDLAYDDLLMKDVQEA